jgi:hypothetical protein
MSAAEILREARSAGIDLCVEGGDLALQAHSEPPADLLQRLARHKAEIVALLRPGRDGWSSEDWQVYFDERAAIAEYDGGLPRPQAEVLALACCVAEWMDRTPAHTPNNACAGCGGLETANDPLLPYGGGAAGHSWLHAPCWQGWFDRQKAEAETSLTALLGLFCIINQK